MRTMLFLGLALLLAGCPCPDPKGIREVVTSDKVQVPLYSELAYQVIAENSPCGVQPSGVIYWMYSPTDQEVVNACYIPAWGCADPWGCEFTVWIATWNPRANAYLANVWNTALVNEIGYWYWNKCYDRYPEHYVVDPVTGKSTEVLDEDFRLWIINVNSEIQSRATALIYSPIQK